jgi:hypothetical protein
MTRDMGSDAWIDEQILRPEELRDVLRAIDAATILRSGEIDLVARLDALHWKIMRVLEPPERVAAAAVV